VLVVQSLQVEIKSFNNIDITGDEGHGHSHTNGATGGARVSVGYQYVPYMEERNAYAPYDASSSSSSEAEDDDASPPYQEQQLVAVDDQPQPLVSDDQNDEVGLFC
jgi:hypothetical protein